MSNDASSPKRTAIIEESLWQKLSKNIKKLCGVKHSSFEESVTELIREHDEDTSVHDEEKAILKNIVTFGDLEASDVMLPRTEIIAAPVNIKPDDLKEIFLKEGHSRIPIYSGSIDNIIGFTHIKDLFKNLSAKNKFAIKDIIRELIYVPTSIKVTDLLSKMKQSSSHIAIVLDEYGGTDGLVTIEDIIEEIFGEIVDEHDQHIEHALMIEDANGYIIDAKARIEDVEDKFNIKLKDKHSNYDTFGGYLITFLGRIPAVGELITLSGGLTVEILDADQRKVKMLRVTLQEN
jgi:magnesium and cobalt transporter